MNTLVLGIGNLILTDDGVGLKVARKLGEEKPEWEVMETSEAGLVLLELVAGYDKLIIIDSVKTEGGKPGEVYKLGLEDLGTVLEFPSSHGIGIPDAFELGEKLGYKIPKQVSIYAIEVKDNLSFAEECTPEIEERIPSIARQIIEEERLN